MKNNENSPPRRPNWQYERNVPFIGVRSNGYDIGGLSQDKTDEYADITRESYTIYN
jgi:hypothetical protein